MKLTGMLANTWSEFLSAIQFLTRIPVPSQAYRADSLFRSAKFFPVVGVLVGGAAALCNQMLTTHVPRAISSLLVLLCLLLITGCLHEDGLADAADGFGGGWNREQVLLILRDSRIGSYGCAALTLSLLGRLLLLSSLPVAQVGRYLIAAHVLCRWTTLPLGFFLPAARALSNDEPNGQGARVAQLISRGSLIAGTGFSFSIAFLLLGARAVPSILCVGVLSLVTGLYYKKRIGGVTGDCFGATNQLAEISVYLCGVWTA